MAELKGRVALVTGASRGIGAATARALAAEGARVIVTDVLDTSAVARELDGLARRLDVTSEADWAETIAFARREAGGLDILVNNAGILGKIAPTTEVSLEDWRRLHAVNVEGVFLGCKHAIPALAERASRWAGGTAIINLSSIVGLVGFGGAACYSAAKGAVRLMTKSLALELAPLKIRVNSVHPGIIETHMGEAVVEVVAGLMGIGDNATRAELDRRHPVGHFGQPSNIGDAIAFLASDKAAFMTGAEMVVDGGWTAQ
jgi:NAD(P)-dependent dehydrogenase (short-subunit alcohol dehydrogenase family)